MFFHFLLYVDFLGKIKESINFCLNYFLFTLFAVLSWKKLKNLSLPVGPGLDLVPQVGAGAFGGADLTMSVQNVGGLDLTSGNGISQQALGGIDLSGGGFVI